jgi:hypothetical protein
MDHLGGQKWQCHQKYERAIKNCGEFITKHNSEQLSLHSFNQTLLKEGDPSVISRNWSLSAEISQYISDE